MATIYRVDGTIEQVEPESKKKGFTLKELYKHTNSEIVEIVYTLPGIKGSIMVVDEEGMYNNKLRNESASIMVGGMILGDVLVCKNSEVK